MNLVFTPIIFGSSKNPSLQPITAYEYDTLAKTFNEFNAYHMTTEQYDTNAKNILTGVENG